MPTVTRNRLKGKSISFTVGAVEYLYDVTSVLFTHEEAEDDVVTFADAAAGGSYEWTCTVNAVQSTDADSLHTFLWANAGSTVAFKFAPKGNTSTPTVTSPHYTGSVIVPGKKPDLGGDAGADNTWTYEVAFKVVGDITKVTA